MVGKAIQTVQKTSLRNLEIRQYLTYVLMYELITRIGKIVPNMLITDDGPKGVLHRAAETFM